MLFCIKGLIFICFPLGRSVFKPIMLAGNLSSSQMTVGLRHILCENLAYQLATIGNGCYYSCCKAILNRDINHILLSDP